MAKGPTRIGHISFKLFFEDEEIKGAKGTFIRGDAFSLRDGRPFLYRKQPMQAPESCMTPVPASLSEEVREGYQVSLAYRCAR